MKKPLLQRLSKEDKAELLAHSVKVSVRKGKFLFLEGDQAQKIYFIHSGIIRVYKMITEGNEVTIFLRGKDDGFGEIGPFSGQTYSCSAQAETDCELYVIDFHVLEQLLELYGRISLQFAHWMAESLETSSSKLKDYMMFGSEGAVASVLIRLSNMRGKETSAGIAIPDMITLYSIGTHVSLRRETVTRIFSEWKTKGIIDMNKRTLLIKDMDYLKNILSCNKCGVQNCVL